ncbi:DUF1003 domain-containing protein [Streptomyces narbonensis]
MAAERGQERERDRERPMARIRLDLPRERRARLLPEYDPEAFGRTSERIARFLGTGRFLVWMTLTVVVWIGWNIFAPASLRFDEYPFIFLTLALSLQASYAAPLILLAQNRQDDRDRVNLEQDRKQNERSIADTEYLTPRRSRPTLWTACHRARSTRAARCRPPPYRPASASAGR